MIKLANGKEVTLDEFLSWSAAKQNTSIRPPMLGKKRINNRLGKKHSAETIDKIRAAAYRTREIKIKVNAELKQASKPIMTPNGLFPSLTAVAQAAGVRPSTVWFWKKKWPEHYYYV
jgi:hypothetical protein